LPRPKIVMLKLIVVLQIGLPPLPLLQVSRHIPKKQKIKKHTQIWIQDIPSSTSPTWSSRSDAEKEVCFNWKTKD